MTPIEEPYDEAARLLRIGRPVGIGQRALPNHAYEIARGNLADLLTMVRDDEGELWRYTVVLAGDRHVRNAALRELVRN